eukprot:1158806-Pelagomonas_calceolata.AAC.4
MSLLPSFLPGEHKHCLCGKGGLFGGATGFVGAGQWPPVALQPLSVASGGTIGFGGSGWWSLVAHVYGGSTGFVGAGQWPPVALQPLLAQWHTAMVAPQALVAQIGGPLWLSLW